MPYFWIIIVVLLLALFLYFSEFNTQAFNIHGIKYNVHNHFEPKSSAECLAEIDRRILVLQKHMLQKYGCHTCPQNMKARVHQLFENYSSENLYEISPLNIMGNTSFTERKTKMVFCLRDKDTKKIHDINTIMFVALHEVTHVMSDRWGHEIYFWDLFKIILEEAVIIGIYVPVDYEKYPVKYCGINITQSPLNF